ncbi:hypothetical protein DICA1_F11826 [Diutina catenulata]
MYIKKPNYSGSSSPLRIPSLRSRSKSRRDRGDDDADPQVDDQSVGSGQIYHTNSYDDRRERRRASRSHDDMKRSRSAGRSRHDDDRRSERRERRHRDDDDRRSERRERRHRDDDARSERRERRHRDDDARSERRERRASRHDRDDRGDHHRSERKSKKSSRNGGAAAGGAAAAPARKKVEIPKNVNYRPGRIQSLSAEQEPVHKQFWAYFLTYWGYELSIDPSELKYSDCFVASSGLPGGDANGLSRTATRGSMQSGTTSASKKKKGLFGGGGGSTTGTQSQHVTLNAPADSPRMRDIATKSSQERFIPTDVPSEDVVNAYVNHYKLSFEHSPDYVDDGGAGGDSYDEVSDVDSVESFVTADTTITTPDDTPTFGSSQKRGGTSSGAMLSMPSVPKKPVHSSTTNQDIGAITPLQWQQMFMGAARNDLPDNFLLRFMRARKWNTDNALKMLSNSIKWRMEFPADKWVKEADGPSFLNGTNQGFIKNLTTEKSWIKGEDNNQNPIFWFQAKKHFGSDSPSDETQRYAVTTIEWVRLFLREVNESVDTVSIVFDLTGFTLKNADYTTIKFLAEVFEAHYPECLGRIYVHNAPWIFSTVWNIIKNWLDPVVASKIVFTKNFKDMSGYISPDYIPTELGGIDTSGPEYPTPQPGDDKPPKDKDATYRRLMKERDVLMMRLFDCTRKWVESTNPDVSAQYLEEKIGINIELSYNYIALDPYVRNPCPYDRLGSLDVRN